MWISNEKKYEELYHRLSRFSTEYLGGVDVAYLPETESTNTWVKEHVAAGYICYEDIIVFTRHQTAGRGTHNRTWLQRAGLDAAITLSMVMGFKAPDPRTTLAVGAAVAKAIEELHDIPVGLKWPNDIMLLVNDEQGERWVKTGGILVETADGRLVIGVGINCNSKARHFPDELSGNVTSLKDATGNHQDVCKLVEGLFHALVRIRDAVRKEDLEDLLAEWKTRNRTGGTRYLLNRDGVTHEVTAVDVVFPEGWLNVVDDNGQEYVVISHSELSVPDVKV